MFVLVKRKIQRDTHQNTNASNRGLETTGGLEASLRNSTSPCIGFVGHLQCVVCEVGEGFLLLGGGGSDVEDGCTKKRFRNLSLCF